MPISFSYQNSFCQEKVRIRRWRQAFCSAIILLLRLFYAGTRTAWLLTGNMRLGRVLDQRFTHYHVPYMMLTITVRREKLPYCLYLCLLLALYAAEVTILISHRTHYPSKLLYPEDFYLCACQGKTRDKTLRLTRLPHITRPGIEKIYHFQ